MDGAQVEGVVRCAANGRPIDLRQVVTEAHGAEADLSHQRAAQA